MSNASKNDTKFSLTAVLVEDKTKGFTSFFAQFPNIIAEGDNEEDAMSNLFKLVITAFEHQKNQEMKSSLVGVDSSSVKTRSYEFASL